MSFTACSWFSPFRERNVLDLKYRNHGVFILLGCGDSTLAEWCVTFRNSVMVSFQGAKYPHFLQMLDTNQPAMRHHIPEEWRPQLSCSQSYRNLVPKANLKWVFLHSSFLEQMDLHFGRLKQMNVCNYLVSLSVLDFLHLERQIFPYSWFKI